MNNRTKQAKPCFKMETKKRLNFSTQGFLKEHGAVLLIVFVLCALTYNSFLSRGLVYTLVNLDADTVARQLGAYNTIAPLLFVFLVVIEVVTAPIPPFILYTAAGFLFGAFWGGTLALLGNVIGSVIAFTITRRFGRGFVEKKIPSKQLDRFDRYSNKYGGLAIFLLRLNPLTSSDVVSYIAGLTTMRYRALVFGTAFGIIPTVYAQTFLGNDILKNNPTLSLVYIWISIAYLVAILYGALYARKKLK